jgi:choline-sulfatase
MAFCRVFGVLRRADRAWLPALALATGAVVAAALLQSLGCSGAAAPRRMVDPHAISEVAALPGDAEARDGGSEEEPGSEPANDAADTAPDGSAKAGTAVSAEHLRPPASEPICFLLLTVDTLRPDLGYMGYGRPVSPNIDRLAERSVVYERAYAISTYTGFAIPPMMASRYPSEMPRTDRHEVRYLAQNVMLAERLRAAGYHTAGAASHFLFAPTLGWIDGFERFARVPLEGDAPSGSSVDSFHSSRGLADAAIQMLSDSRITSGPFFIWIHFLDPHGKYLEHKGFSTFGHDPRALYDGEIAYTDFHIGRVLDALAASPIADRTAVILTADHGEAFGEHGEYHHGRHVWDEIVRIPLVVSVPGASPRRIARRMSVVELAPTILDLAGLPADPGARGQSFAPEIYGADLPARPVLIDQPRNPYYPLKRAFIEGDYKLHHLPESKTYLLFDLAADPGEKSDLAPGQPDLVAAMRQSYESLMSGIVEVAPVPVAPVVSVAPVAPESSRH